MKTQLLASLEDVIQGWLEANADDIGTAFGIWQDNTAGCRNAVLMSKMAMGVIEAQELQSDLEQRMREEGT